MIGGCQLRIANQQMILNCYNFNYWDTVLKFKDLFPADSTMEFSAIIEKGKVVVRSKLQVP